MQQRLLGVLALACTFAMPVHGGPRVTHAEQLDAAWQPMKMSCGQRLNAWALVASVEPGAYPCLSWLKILNVETGLSVPVLVIDDAQFGADGITILLSPQAADLIGMKERARVKIMPLRSRSSQP